MEKTEDVLVSVVQLCVVFVCSLILIVTWLCHGLKSSRRG